MHWTEKVWQQQLSLIHIFVEGRADGIVYGKFQPDLPAATESVLQPEMEFAAEIPPEEEILSLIHI